MKGNASDLLRGSPCGRSKLTERKVAEARRLYRAGASLDALSELYIVAVETIRNAICGKTWDHVPGALPYNEIRRSFVKLNEASVAEMRQLYRAGANFVALGARFGISAACARDAVTGKTWAQVPGVVGHDEIRHLRMPKLTQTVLNPMAKLRAADLRLIRKLYCAGASTTEIGDRFGVPTATIRAIGKGLG